MEVFQGYRMVLKGYVSVGLGQVPGVTGLGEEAQVGEVEPSNHFPLFSQPWSCNLFLVKRMRSQRCQENDIGRKYKYGKTVDFRIIKPMSVKVSVKTIKDTGSILAHFPTHIGG